MTRDLGGTYERYQKYKFDKALFVVAAQQDFYFKQVFKTLELMGYEWANRCQHISFGEQAGLALCDNPAQPSPSSQAWSLACRPVGARSSSWMTS